MLRVDQTPYQPGYVGYPDDLRLPLAWGVTALPFPEP